MYSIHTGHVRTFGTVDYVMFVVTLLVSAGIGIFFAIWDRRRNTRHEFLLGGQRMRVFPVAMSLMVTFVSSLTLLGYPAEMYNYNTMFWLLVPSFLLSVGGASFFFIPFFYRLGVTSTFEYLEMRFNKSSRVLCCVLMIVQTVMYMSTLLYAPSLALNAVTGINLWGCVAAMGIVSTFYTTLGGMKAVLWTDTFQAVVISAGLLAILIRGIQVQGGVETVWNIANNRSRILFDDWNPDPRTRHTVWSMMIGAGLFWLFLYGINQAQVQRCLATPSVSKARLAMLVSLPGLMIIVSLSCLLGVAMFAFYSDCDPIKFGLISKPDQLVPLFVMDILGPYDGLPGIFVSAVLSGSLSSLSSALNALSAITLKDLLEGLGWKSNSELRSTVVSKLIVMLYGLLAVGFAWVISNLGGVLQAVYMLQGILNGPTLGVFTLGMWFPWANSRGAICGQVVALALVTWIGLGAFIHKLYTPMTPTVDHLCNWTVRASPWNRTTTTAMVPTGALMNVTTLQLLPDSSDQSSAGVLEPLYQLSYMWYTGLGALTVWVVGIPVSLITGFRDKSKVDAKLLMLPSCFGFKRSDKGSTKRELHLFKDEVKKLYVERDGLVHLDDVIPDEKDSLKPKDLSL